MATAGKLVVAHPARVLMKRAIYPSEAENRHGASAVDLCEVVWPLVEVGGGQPSLEVKCDMCA